MGLLLEASCQATMEHLKNIDCKSIMAESALGDTCDKVDNYFKNRG
jgi:hypothetical protein